MRSAASRATPPDKDVLAGLLDAGAGYVLGLLRRPGPHMRLWRRVLSRSVDEIAGKPERPRLLPGTAPEFFPVIVGRAGQGPAAPPLSEEAAVRVVIEKPFGTSLAQARRPQPDGARRLLRASRSSGSTTTSARRPSTTCWLRLADGDLRATLESQPHRQRADHRRRGHRHRGSRPASTSRPASSATSSRTTCSRSCSLGHDGGSRPRSPPTISATRRASCCWLSVFRGAVTLNEGFARTTACAGRAVPLVLSPGGRRRARLADASTYAASALHDRQLAVDGRAVLPARRQEDDRAAHRGRDPLSRACRSVRSGGRGRGQPCCSRRDAHAAHPAARGHLVAVRREGAGRATSRSGNVGHEHDPTPIAFKRLQSARRTSG